MKFIHYGNTKFDPSLFRNVKNEKFPHSKPRKGTGLWASPNDSNYSWKHWNESEQFMECDENNSFIFSLSNKANIFIIDSIDDLKMLPIIKHNSFIAGIDFEKLTEKYDAILLTEKGQAETRYDDINGVNLYRWDCECILVLKSDNLIF